MKTALKIIIFTSVTISFIACKPKETPLLSAKDWIVGSWKLQQQGTDNNNNRKFETNEKNPVADTAKFTFQLLDNGKGYKIGANNSYVDTLEWALYNFESNLHFKIFDRGFVNNLHFKFETGTKTLLLLDTTVSPGYYRYFERQN